MSSYHPLPLLFLLCSIWGEQWESLQSALPEELCSKLSEIVLAHGTAMASQLDGATEIPEGSKGDKSPPAQAGQNDRERSRELRSPPDGGAQPPSLFNPP